MYFLQQQQKNDGKIRHDTSVSLISPSILLFLTMKIVMETMN